MNNEDRDFATMIRMALASETLLRGPHDGNAPDGRRHAIVLARWAEKPEAEVPVPTGLAAAGIDIVSLRFRPWLEALGPADAAVFARRHCADHAWRHCHVWGSPRGGPLRLVPDDGDDLHFRMDDVGLIVVPGPPAWHDAAGRERARRRTSRAAAGLSVIALVVSVSSDGLP